MLDMFSCTEKQTNTALYYTRRQQNSHMFQTYTITYKKYIQKTLKNAQQTFCRVCIHQAAAPSM